MTIDEAIAIIEALHRGGITPNHENPRQAFKIAIEAMKRCKRARETGTFIPVYPLEGEAVK